MSKSIHICQHGNNTSQEILGTYQTYLPVFSFVLNCARVWTYKHCWVWQLVLEDTKVHSNMCRRKQRFGRRCSFFSNLLDGHIKGFVSWAPHVCHNFPFSVSTQTAALC